MSVTNMDLSKKLNLAAREAQFVWHVLPGASTLDIKKPIQRYVNREIPEFLDEGDHDHVYVQRH